MIVAIEESVKNLTKKMSWLNESHTQVKMGGGGGWVEGGARTSKREGEKISVQADSRVDGDEQDGSVEGVDEDQDGGAREAAGSRGPSLHL